MHGSARNPDWGLNVSAKGLLWGCLFSGTLWVLIVRAAQWLIS
jgi:hypothetical protein